MSEIKVDTVAEKTSANGVTVDGLNIKDSKLVTSNSVVEANITDANITTDKISDDAVTADKLANSINTAIAANTAKTTNATHTGEVTGATALTIADNIVDEANLKVSNSPTNGYFLSAQSGNTGGMTWAEAGGGGKINQVINASTNNQASTGSQSYGDTSLTASITPSASNSKILVLTSQMSFISSNSNAAARYYINLVRGSTEIAEINVEAQTNVGTNGLKIPATYSHCYLDSPSTTSSTTYKTQFKTSRSGADMRVQDGWYSYITLIEVLA